MANGVGLGFFGVARGERLLHFGRNFTGLAECRRREYRSSELGDDHATPDHGRVEAFTIHERLD